jgi:hypothetical protein
MVAWELRRELTVVPTEASFEWSILYDKLEYKTLILIPHRSWNRDSVFAWLQWRLYLH